MSDKNLSDLSNIDRDHNEVIIGSRAFIIRKLRIILPVVATCLLFAVLVFSDRKDPIEATPIKEIIEQETGENELVNPQFESIDEKNRPYTITSERAYQKNTDSNDIQLDRPKANMRFDDDTTISLEGKNGIYDQENKRLHLEGDVRFLQNEGYEIITDKVDIDINKQTATSDSPVSGHGPTGHVKASGLSANGESSIFIFKGPATLTINPKSNEKTEEKAEEKAEEETQ